MNSIKVLNPKKWMRTLLLLIVVQLLSLAVLAYVVDPFFLFRVKDETYMTSATFSTPGLVKNHQYNTALIGSSMVWDFDMPLLRETMMVEPLKVTIGAMTIKEMLTMMELLEQSGKVEQYIINVDFPALAVNPENQKLLYPEFLVDFNPWNDYLYLLGFETWMRFIPVDLAFLLADTLGINLPYNFVFSRNIDNLGRSRTMFTYGRDIVLDSLRNRALSPLQINGLHETMLQQANVLITSIAQTGKQTLVFFPPYSALFWLDARIKGYDKDFLEIKHHIINTLLAMNHVRVFDFQSATVVTDLNNYKDITHFSPEVSDWIIKCFSDGTYEVREQYTEDDVVIFNRKLDHFEAENAAWLTGVFERQH